MAGIEKLGDFHFGQDFQAAFGRDLCIDYEMFHEWLVSWLE
jgi:hypothetical protein